MINFLDRHEACVEGREWALTYCNSMAEVWDKARPDWLIWVATRPSVLPSLHKIVDWIEDTFEASYLRDKYISWYRRDPYNVWVWCLIVVIEQDSKIADFVRKTYDNPFKGPSTR